MGDFSLLYEKHGIRSYEKQLPGTDVREYKAVGFVEAPMDVVGEVILDVAAYPRWMADVKEARIVKDVDRHTKVVHCRLKLPWPLTDRDFVVANKTAIEVDKARCRIDFSAVDDRSIRPARKVVRMKELTGGYLLEHMGQDRTLVTFSQKAHPGGNLAPTIANVNIQHYPHRNLQGLRKMARQEVYHRRAAVSEDRALIDEVLQDKEKIKEVMRQRLLEFLPQAELVDMLFENNPEIEALAESELTFGRIRDHVTGTIRKLFELEAAEALLESPVLKSRIRNNPALLEELLADDDLVFSLLERSRPFEEILLDRLR